MKWEGSGSSSEGPEDLRLTASVALFDSRLDIHVRVLGMFKPDAPINEVKEQVIRLIKERTRACVDQAISEFHKERAAQKEWYRRHGAQPGPLNGPP